MNTFIKGHSYLFLITMQKVTFIEFRMNAENEVQPWFQAEPGVTVSHKDWRKNFGPYLELITGGKADVKRLG